MAKERKKYEDDDGRTVADMSGVTKPNLWSVRFPSSAPWNQSSEKNKGAQADAQEGENTQKPWTYESNLSKEDRRVYILAAVGSGLAIAAVFGIVFAIFIFLIGHVHC